MKVYQPLETKNPETGLFYKVWDIPDGMPIAMGMITVAPTEDLSFPKYNSSTGFWEEDVPSLIEDFGLKKSLLETQVERLKKDNAELKSSLEETKVQLSMNEDTILELADMILS